MPATIQWDDPEQLNLLVTFTAPITWTEFRDAIDSAHKRAAAVDHAVSLLIWTQAALPPGFALPNLRGVFQTQPANVERIIIIPGGQSTMLAFVKRLASVLQQIYPQKGRVTFVDLLDAARELITENRVNPV